jgi:hypothetical protein
MWLLPVPLLPTHQHLVQRWQRQEVEAIEAFNGREPRRLDPAFHHASLAINHLHLGQPHQVTRMVDAFSRTQPGDLVVLPQERRQLQRLQMVGEQDLRCVGHAVTPANRSMYDRADVVATVALGKYG